MHGQQNIKFKIYGQQNISSIYCGMLTLKKWRIERNEKKHTNLQTWEVS
jgi:hypothetical protein